jgi:hypothetical protein
MGKYRTKAVDRPRVTTPQRSVRWGVDPDDPDAATFRARAFDGEFIPTHLSLWVLRSSQPSDMSFAEWVETLNACPEGTALPEWVEHQQWEATKRRYPHAMGLLEETDSATT